MGFRGRLERLYPGLKVRTEADAETTQVWLVDSALAERRRPLRSLALTVNSALFREEGWSSKANGPKSDEHADLHVGFPCGHRCQIPEDVFKALRNSELTKLWFFFEGTLVTDALCKCIMNAPRSLKHLHIHLERTDGPAPHSLKLLPTVWQPPPPDEDGSESSRSDSSSIDVCGNYGDALRRCDSLETVSFVANCREHVDTFAAVVCKFPSVRNFDLRYIGDFYLRYSVVDEVSRMLDTNHSLLSLTFGGFSFDHDQHWQSLRAVRAVFGRCCAHPRLRKLRLNVDCPHIHYEIPELEHMLRTSANLTLTSVVIMNKIVDTISDTEDQSPNGSPVHFYRFKRSLKRNRELWKQRTALHCLARIGGSGFRSLAQISFREKLFAFLLPAELALRTEEAQEEHASERSHCLAGSGELESERQIVEMPGEFIAEHSDPPAVIDHREAELLEEQRFTSLIEHRIASPAASSGQLPRRVAVLSFSRLSRDDF